MSKIWIALTVDDGLCDEVSASISGIHGAEAYCPRITTWRKVPKHRRLKVGRSREPIAVKVLEGYVLCSIQTDAQLHQILELKGVYGFVGRNGKPCLARDEDVKAFRQWCEFNATLTSNEPKAKPRLDVQSFIGRPMQVARGVLAGRGGMAVGHEAEGFVLYFGENTAKAKVPASNLVLY